MYMKKIVLLSDEALVARSYLDASFPVIITLNARTNVASVMNGEPHSTTSLLIMHDLRLGIALRAEIMLFSR
jgi:hypothetical protein